MKCRQGAWSLTSAVGEAVAVTPTAVPPPPPVDLRAEPNDNAFLSVAGPTVLGEYPDTTGRNVQLHNLGEAPVRVSLRPGERRRP